MYQSKIIGSGTFPPDTKTRHSSTGTTSTASTSTTSMATQDSARLPVKQKNSEEVYTALRRRRRNMSDRQHQQHQQSDRQHQQQQSSSSLPSTGSLKEPSVPLQQEQQPPQPERRLDKYGFVIDEPHKRNGNGNGRSSPTRRTSNGSSPHGQHLGPGPSPRKSITTPTKTRAYRQKQKAARIAAKKEEYRVKKWQNMMNSWSSYTSSQRHMRERGLANKKLRHRARKGVPDNVRGDAWMLLGGVQDRIRINKKGVYSSLIQRSNTGLVHSISAGSLSKADDTTDGDNYSGCSSVMDTIERDINRTFPRHYLFMREGGDSDDESESDLGEESSFFEDTEDEGGIMNSSICEEAEEEEEVEEVEPEGEEEEMEKKIDDAIEDAIENKLPVYRKSMDMTSAEPTSPSSPKVEPSQSDESHVSPKTMGKIDNAIVTALEKIPVHPKSELFDEELKRTPPKENITKVTPNEETEEVETQIISGPTRSNDSNHSNSNKNDDDDNAGMKQEEKRFRSVMERVRQIEQSQRHIQKTQSIRSPPRPPKIDIYGSRRNSGEMLVGFGGSKISDDDEEEEEDDEEDDGELLVGFGRRGGDTTTSESESDKDGVPAWVEPSARAEGEAQLGSSTEENKTELSPPRQRPAEMDSSTPKANNAKITNINALSKEQRNLSKEQKRRLRKEEEYKTATGGQASLRRVLRAYSIYDRDVGYCQGMNFIAAMFITFMGEEEAFWMLVYVMNDPPCRMRGLFGEEMTESHQVLFIAEKLISHFLPKLSQHLEKEGVHITMFATQWLLTLYTSSFPFDLVTRVWDCFLAEGWKIIYRVMLAILDMSQKELMGMSFESILGFFRNVPNRVDGETVLDVALKIPLKRKHIAKYQKDFMKGEKK
mmetsp:Transcript_3828/g.5651  ORF Transcript_3828/g.5651 Transcript_3828/m.5651 type:complete len:881 (+) Transcript_3828:231-2873(+)